MLSTTQSRKPPRPAAWRPALRIGCIVLALVALLGLGQPASRAASINAAPAGKSTIGDYVWLDANLDGQHTGADAEYTAGINHVLVNLYLDANGNGQIDAGEFIKAMYTGDNPATTTVETGWYDFGVDGLKQYIVALDASNFLPGGPLADYFLTSADTYGTSPLVVYLPTAIEDYNDADFGFALNPLQVTKALLSTTPYAAVGDAMTFRITVHNAGPVTLNPVPLDDFYSPACLQFVSATVTPSSVDTALGKLHWNNIGPLAAGASTFVDVTFKAQNTQEMVWKEGGWQDYAPKGIPDFDERQAGADSPVGSGAGWHQCGPAAVANSLWWFDSKFESGTVKPPAINDTYPLVQSFSAAEWDDHDVRNVRPLISQLSTLMGTTAAAGTTVTGLAAGVTQYIADHGLAADYTVTTQQKPTFAWVGDEVRRSEDVVLLLGFWQESPTGAPAVRIGGHYVTASGVDLASGKISVSDPYRNQAEATGAGRVLPGPHAASHPTVGPAGDTLHNDAQYVSQDVYLAGTVTLSAGQWGLSGYVDPLPAAGCDQIAAFQGKNAPAEFVTQQGVCNKQDGLLSTVVEYAVAVSPKIDTLMCSPTTNIAAVSEATPENTEIVLPPKQDEEHVTQSMDLGDLPDSPYPTLLATNGARHLITSPLRLGARIDSELNGQPSVNTDGDDLNGAAGDDEDGVTFMPGLAGSWKDGAVAAGRGGSLQIVISGGRGVPQLFMDFFGGGLGSITLRDATGAPLPTTPWASGTYVVYFDLPAGFEAAAQLVHARVRLSSSGGLAATGLALNGEIEDYLFSFAPTAVQMSGLSAVRSRNWSVGLALLGLVAAGWVGWRFAASNRHRP